MIVEKTKKDSRNCKVWV